MKKIISLILMLTLGGWCGCSAIAVESEISPEATQYYNKGISFFEKKDYKTAAANFKMATQLAPDFADAYFNLATIYDILDEYENAVDAYSQVLRLNPQDYDTIFELARICYDQGNYLTALKYAKYIPSSYDDYELVKRLVSDSQKLLDVQKERMSRAKINTANPNNKVILDSFPSPTGVAVDSKGNVFVACYADNSIKKISKNKEVSNFVNNSGINGPIGLAIDKFDNVYVANYENNNILKIAPNGRVYVFMDNVSKPYYLYINNDVLYISEQNNNIVLKYNLQ